MSSVLKKADKLNLSLSLGASDAHHVLRVIRWQCIHILVSVSMFSFLSCTPVTLCKYMMTSSNGNIFRVTGRSPVNSPHKASDAEL